MISGLGSALSGILQGTSLASGIRQSSGIQSASAQAPAQAAASATFTRRTDYTNANLFGADLSGQDLSGVDFTGANLQGANAAWGTLLVFLSAVSYAIYLVYSGEMVQRLGSLRLVGLATTVACLCCLLQFVVLRPLSAAVVAPEVIWLSVLNATLCTAAPVLMVMMAIERIGAGMAAQTGMVGPLSTILMGVWILGEPFTAWVAAGTVLVMTGIFIFTRMARRP